HIRARDPWLLAGGAAVLLLTPWNPLVWWQVRRLRLAVEMDCDARVLARDGDAPAYGELLLRVGQRRARLPLGAPALGEPVSFLGRRIRRMVTALPRWRWAGAAAGGLIAVAAVIAACEAPWPVGPQAPRGPAPGVRSGREGLRAGGAIPAWTDARAGRARVYQVSRELSDRKVKRILRCARVPRARSGGPRLPS